MAYQNVSTPRFYVSILQYLKHFGLLTMTSEDTVQYIYNKELLSLADVNPSSQAIMNVPSAAGMLPIVYKLNDGLSFQNIMPSDQNFFMILGHKFAEGISDGRVKCYARTGSDDTLNVATTGVINFNDTYEANYNGFSISKGNDAHDLDDQIQIVISQYQGTFNYPIGCFLYGTYYDMTSSPNLSLKMSREYGNTDEQVTHNGSSFINQAWLKPPNWGEAGAWEIYNNTATGDSDWLNTDKDLSRSGRKSWDLKFSYIDDSDIFGSNQSLSNLNIVDTNYDSGDITNAGDFEFNLLTDNSFFSQVWQKTLGGTLPFVFQPDNSNNNPDQFAVCRFAGDSLKVNQTAFNVYDISLKIEEVW